MPSFESDTLEGLEERIRVLTGVKQPLYQDALAGMAEKIIEMYQANIEKGRGNKLLIFGNGGSAEQTSHIATELIVRYRGRRNRPSLPAIALTDIGAITAAANDFGYEKVFSRQIEGLVAAGDIALGISTSGRSPNVLEALREAKKRGAVTMALTGEQGLSTAVDYSFEDPSEETAIVQEVHLYAIHWMCERIDKFFEIK